MLGEESAQLRKVTQQRAWLGSLHHMELDIVDEMEKPAGYARVMVTEALNYLHIDATEYLFRM